MNLQPGEPFAILAIEPTGTLTVSEPRTVASVSPEIFADDRTLYSATHLFPEAPGLSGLGEFPQRVWLYARLPDIEAAKLALIKAFVTSHLRALNDIQAKAQAIQEAILKAAQLTP